MSASVVMSDIHELRSIEIELETRRKYIKTLTARKSVLEKNIITYLEENSEQGLKYRDTAVILTKVLKRKCDKKTDKVDIVKQFLSSTCGIRGPSERMAKELLVALKGQTEEKPKLTLRKIN